MIPEARLAVYVRHHPVGTNFETEIGARNDKVNGRELLKDWLIGSRTRVRPDFSVLKVGERDHSLDEATGGTAVVHTELDLDVQRVSRIHVHDPPRSPATEPRLGDVHAQTHCLE